MRPNKRLVERHNQNDMIYIDRPAPVGIVQQFDVVTRCRRDLVDDLVNPISKILPANLLRQPSVGIAIPVDASNENAAAGVGEPRRCARELLPEFFA
jgi:hypothetical protein